MKFTGIDETEYVYASEFVYCRNSLLQKFYVFMKIIRKPLFLLYKVLCVF
jgi:hypothetical protein